MLLRHSVIQQWLIAGLAGTLLGIWILAAATLSSRWAPLLILAGIGPFVAMMVRDIRKLLLAVIILDIPLQLDTYLAYRAEISQLGALGGINLSATTVSLLILYTLWAIGLLTRIGFHPHPRLRASLPLALYLACVALSTLVAPDVSLSLFQIFLLLQMFLLYVYVASWVRTRQDAIFIVAMLLASVILESTIMIGVYATGADFSIASISTSMDPGFAGRAAGTLRSPNAAAAFLSLTLAPALSLLLTKSGRWIKRLAMLAFGLGLAALILTLSRGAWLAFAIYSVIMCLLLWRRGWLTLGAPVVLAAVGLLLSPVFYDAIWTRLVADDGGSALSRIPLMQLAWSIIKDHPVFGVGANNFVLLIPQYATPAFANAWLYTVHNNYLLVWAETGAVGFIAYTAFLLVTVGRGWRVWRARDPFLSPLALGLAVAVIGHMVHMFVDLFNMRPETQLLWLIAGLIAALNEIDRENNAPRLTKRRRI
jgi:O-antigen ligase